jgi:cytoskeletal protein CcmA (bactofilin family)
MKGTALILTSALVAVAGAGAADFSAEAVKSGSYVHVPAGEVLKGGTVLAGSVVVVDGDVDGDLVAFAAYVEVNGNVDGDLLAAAATIVVKGNVSGSAQYYGAAVTDAGSTAGSLAASGAALFLRGNVAGDVASSGAATWLGGAFGGDVEAESGYLVVEDDARVGGDVSYRADELDLSPAAAIGGRVKELPEPEPTEEEEKGFNFGWWLIKNVWSILALFVLAAFVAWLRPVMLTAIPDNIRARPVASLLLGLAVLVGAPVAALVLAITLVGIPSALVLAAFYAMALYAAYVFAGVFLGRLIAAWLFKGRETPVLFAALIGIVILVLAGNIPYFKVLLALAVWVFALGGAAIYAWEMRTTRPQR